jgi:hypothetical protein
MDNNKKWALHEIIIKKPIELEVARELAQDIMKNKKRFVKETKTMYKFRNLPKTKFIPGTIKREKINKQLILVYGELKQEFGHLEGAGFFDFIKKGVDAVKNVASKGVQSIKKIFTPRLDNYNNTTRRTLEQYGNEPIMRLTICRTPIMQILDKVINIISLGKWSASKKENGFDQLFHLQLVANIGNKNIVIEKNEVINVNTSFKTSKDTEVMEVPLKSQITVNEMFEKGQKNVGNEKWFTYDPFLNNCQYFIKYCLEAVDLYGEKEKDFLFQDITEIVKKMPSYVGKVAKAVTTTGAVFNKLTGQGEDICEHCGQQIIDKKLDKSSLSLKKDSDKDIIKKKFSKK